MPFEGSGAQEPRIADLAHRDAPTCGLGDRLGEVRDRIRTAGWTRCWVVNDERVLLGQLRAKELDGDPEATIEQAMLPGPSTFRPNVTAHELLHVMADHDMEVAPVTTSDGRLVGVVRAEDLARPG